MCNRFEMQTFPPKKTSFNIEHKIVHTDSFVFLHKQKVFSINTNMKAKTQIYFTSIKTILRDVFFKSYLFIRI